MKVTGGGQVIASGSSGAGNTIGFNAQQNGAFVSSIAPAKGQLQIVDRTAGTGQAQVKFHGGVTCIRDFTDDNGTADPSDDEVYIRFGGYQKVKGKSTTTPFTTDVQDNGEGIAAVEADVILFRKRLVGDQPCDDSDATSDWSTTTLGRGNVQQH
jgi:hypothetical protein